MTLHVTDKCSVLLLLSGHPRVSQWRRLDARFRSRLGYLSKVGFCGVGVQRTQENIEYDNVYDHFEAFFTVALCFADIYCHPFGGYNVSSEEALKIKKQDYIQPCCGQVTHIHSS